MAEARKVVGWFYRNGKRIPIFEKRERDIKEGTYQGKSVTVGSEVDVPGGKGTVQRLYETSNPDLIYKNRIRVKNSETGDEIDMANGDELNPKFGKTGLRKSLSPNSAKARDRKSRNEILDYDHDTAKAFEGLTQVATPREMANDLGKRVRTADGKITRPVKRSGIDLETRVNNYAAEVAERELNTPSQTFASASKRFKDKAAAEGRTVYEVNSEGNISGVIKPSRQEAQKNAARDYQASGALSRDLQKSIERADTKYEKAVRSPKINHLTGISRASESYIKSVMKDRGLTRAEAVKYIMEQRKKK